jgi:hypothetical protein
MPVIPALRRLRQEEHKFKASLGCILRPMNVLAIILIIIITMKMSNLQCPARPGDDEDFLT